MNYRKYLPKSFKLDDLLADITPQACVLVVLGSLILAFGLYHVHAFSGITEGGVLGLVLLLQHWLDISPSVSGILINVACFLFGWRMLGMKFVIYSGLASIAFSLGYAVCETMDPFWPQLAEDALLAAVAGGLFVGVGCGLCVRAGGATGGDDAFAMAMSKRTGIRIQWLYLITDLIVLGLSVSYIPAEKLAYSLLTVLISGQLTGLIEQMRLPWQRRLVPSES